MSEKFENSSTAHDATFSSQISAKAARKSKARGSTQGVWFGLGMMGLIGWSVVVPTLLGAGIGQWLDSEYPGERSWTLMLLIAGLFIGCLNAWQWVSKQDKAIHEPEENINE